MRRDEGNGLRIPFSAVRSAATSGRNGLDRCRSRFWPGGEPSAGEFIAMGFPAATLRFSLDGVAAQTGLRARRLGGVRADGRHDHDDGRSRPDRKRNQSRDDQAACRGSSGDRPAQPSAARQSADVLYACRRDGRRRSACATDARRPGGKSDAVRYGAAPPRAAPAPRHFDTGEIDAAIGRKGNNNGIYQFGMPRAGQHQEGWDGHSRPRWGRRSQSTSSRLAAARRPLPETSLPRRTK